MAKILGVLTVGISRKKGSAHMINIRLLLRPPPPSYLISVRLSEFSLSPLKSAEVLEL